MAGRTRGYRRAVWALLALALCVRLAFVAATPAYTPVHDDHDYDRLACAVLEGDGYRSVGPPTPPGRCVGTDALAKPTAYRPPLYPLTLAGVYAVAAPIHMDRWTAARVVQAFIGTLGVALIGLVAGLVWGRRVALAALAVAAVHLPFAMVGASLVSETLFIVLELGAIACALLARRGERRWRWIVAAGLLTGLAWLTRSNGLLLLPPLGIAAWTALRPQGRRTAALAVAAFLAVVGLTISPWTLRNAEALHGFVPVATEAGSTLVGTYNDTARLDQVDPGAWWLPREVPKVRAYLHRTPGEPARDRGLTAMAVSYMASHPFYVARVVIRNTLRMAQLTPPSDWRAAGAGIDMPAAAGLLTAAWFWMVLVLAIAGLALGAARGTPRFLWLLAALMYASAAIVISGVRFRMPVEPFVVMLAGVALVRFAGPVQAWLRAARVRRFPARRRPAA
ncbi:MAG TPA: glycosyltransferase family 39 protein [Solirubrobacteraceae bacterium]|jgi:4-amino-4-deoxy-L-arabinose transferase-like glycosyltransferase|nr:glycosyltransferase family 39 protein [Solirubrobacteraceae bacterium]